MKNRLSLYFSIIISLIGFIIQTSSNSNTTAMIDNSEFFDTSNSIFYSTSKEEIETNGNWVYAMFISGILGLILIAVMGIHATVNLFRASLGGKCQRIFYCLLFLMNWSVCFSYTFFKTDIVIASMGTDIDCSVGYFMGTTSVYATKTLLFIVFILRIDTAFHASVLAYNRIFLGILILMYVLTLSGLYVWYISEAWDIIEYQVDYNLFIPVGICTLGTEITAAHSILAIFFFGDLIFSIVVCGLFVYKLSKVIKLTAEHNPKQKKKKPLNRSNSVASQNDKLLKLMKKQTALVAVAVSTSGGVLGLGAVYNPMSLLMPVDSAINVFCVWLMFSFANDIWNKLIKYCCCCCGMNEDSWLQRGTTFSRSLHKRMSIQARSNSTHSQSDKPNSSPPTNDNNIQELPPIAERNSVKHKDIEIKFDNNVTSNDLNLNKNKNTNKDNNIEQVNSDDEDDTHDNDSYDKKTQTHIQNGSDEKSTTDLIKS